MTNQPLSKLFDHTLVKPEATQDQIEKLCEEAIEYGFYSVCVNPIYIRQVYKMLYGTEIKVCSVLDFPLGSSCAYTKSVIADRAISDGADEIDMVIPIGLLRSGYYNKVHTHIAAVKDVIESRILKVIIEIDLLKSPYIIELACKISQDAGADFVKTSTTFFGKGATIEAVKLMRQTVGNSMGVKASGGIRSIDQVNSFIKAGANRIGSSTAIQIMKEYYQLFDDLNKIEENLKLKESE